MVESGIDAKSGQVSRRVIAPLIERVRSDSYALSVLVRDSGLSSAELVNGREGLSWSSFRALLQSADACWGEAAIVAFGEELAHIAELPRFSGVVRRLVGPTDLYLWLAHPRFGRFATLFGSVRCRAWEVTAQQLAFELELEEGNESFPQLLLLVSGLLAGVPTALGLAQAEVFVEPNRRGALFHVRFERHDAIVTRTRRAVRTARRLTIAVEELQAAHDLLNRQYDDLRVAQRALRESEERFRALIENSSDFILLSDAGGRVTYLSPSACRITGFAPAQLVGRIHGDLAHIGDQPALRRALTELESTPGARATVHFRFLTRSQEWIWLEGTAKNMLTEPAIGAVLVNYRNVTDRVQLEEQLLQSRKLESMGRLAGGVAHDFNNLLTGVVGNAQLVLGKLDPQDPRRENICQIVEYSRRASDLTGQLLSFARRQNVKPKRVSFNAAILEARTLLDRLIGDQVEIVALLEPELGTVCIDPSQLQQVIMNLAINARDAMEEGGLLTIQTQNCLEDPSGPQVVLSVADTGAGMDEETLTKVFDPFFTTKELGYGTGLGLATCHGIVSQAGGRIDVRSRLGEGSIFRVSLPRVAGPAEVTAPEEVKAVPRGTETILLVEDEEAVRRTTAELLGGLGYRVLPACHGADALAVLNEQSVRPDAVVTDVVMPKMTGPQLVTRLKEAHPTIGVLYMSGYADDAVPADAPLVRKPFEIAQLAGKLREVLEIARKVTVLSRDEAGRSRVDGGPR